MKLLPEHVAGILTLLWSATSLAQVLCPSAEPHEEQGISPDKCRLDLILPSHAKVTINNHDYGEQRSITLPISSVEPGMGFLGQLFVGVSIDFPNGGRLSGPVEMKGSAVVRVVLSAPPIKPVLFEGPSDDITSLAFSPDGKSIVTGTDAGQAILWAADTGRIRWEGTTPANSAARDGTFVAFSPDGHYLLVGSDVSGIYLWDAATGKQVREIAGDSGADDEAGVNAVAFSPDGRLIIAPFAWVKQPAVAIWDVKSGKRLQTLRGPKAPADQSRHDFSSIAISPDGRHVVAGSWDGKAILFDVSTGRQVRQFQSDSRFISCVAINPDGSRLLTGTEESKAILWDIDSGKRILTLPCTKDEYQYEVHSVAFSPDGRHALAGSGKYTFLFDAATGTTLRAFDSGETHATAFSPDGRHMVTGGTVIWDATTGNRIQTFRRPKDEVRSLAFNDDGQRLTVGYEHDRAIVWNMSAGKPIDVLRQTENKPGKAPQEKLGGLDPFDESDRPPSVPDEYKSPDGRWIVSVAEHNTIVLRDTRTLKKTTLLDYALRPTIRAAFSLKTSRVAVADDALVHIFNPETGKELATLVSAYNGRDWLVTTPGGYYDGTPGGRSLIRWRVGEAEYPLAQFEGQLHCPDVVARVLQEKSER